MGFFSKLFRKRTDSAPQDFPEEADTTVAPAMPPSELPDTDEVVSPQPPIDVVPIAPTSDVPWWASSTPPANAKQELATEDIPISAQPQALVDANEQVDAPSDEESASPGEMMGEDVTMPSLQLYTAAAQPVASVITSRLERDATRELGQDDAPAPALRPSVQGLSAAALRDIGRIRQINQDSVFSLLTTLPREGGDIPMGLFVVADGMGGHDGGEVASRLAVSSVVRHVLSQIVVPALEDGPAEALQPVMIDAIKEANRAVWDQAQADGTDMGTTCTAVLMLGSALYISHVGDSRAYVLEPDGLRMLTNDHSAVGRLIQLGQLEPSEAREHPLRSQLYRTVGQHPQVYVDFMYHHIGEGSHLLMGSDGLWGLLEEDRMEQALRAYVWPQDACRELISLANLAGGDDNISVVVVSFHIAERTTA